MVDTSVVLLVAIRTCTKLLKRVKILRLRLLDKQCLIKLEGKLLMLVALDRFTSLSCFSTNILLTWLNLNHCSEFIVVYGDCIHMK